MQELFDSTFKTAEVAAALEHGNFGVWRRNYNADKLNCLSPFEDAPRGQYTYAQVAEMAVHMSAHLQVPTREIAHLVTWGILDRLVKLKNNSQEFQDAWDAFEARKDELEHLKHCPLALDPLMLAPGMFFGDDVISRDPENRTWALYNTSHAGAGMKAEVRFLQEGNDEPTTLKEMREEAYRLATHGTSDDRSRHLYEEYSFRPYLLDLTGIFNRFEDILDFRFRARTVGR